MKKILNTLLIALLATGAFAYDYDALLSKLDKKYYEQFKDKNISINVYNWGEYISNGEDGSLDVNKAFEKATGIKVNYTNFSTNEELYAKLKVGGVSYDIIIPSDYMIAKMAQEKMIQPLNHKNIPNLNYIDKNVLAKDFDPTNTFSIPYTWGTVVLIYNATMVSPETDVDTWNLMWNEEYAGKILMFNNPRDAYGIALKKLGLSLNPKNQEQIDRATVTLQEQRPIVQAYVMDETFDKLGTAEAAIGAYYAGDAITMMAENKDLRAVHPREGTNIFIDSLCIPSSAKQKEAAEMYINFMLEPEVGASNIEYIGYSTPNTASLKLLPEEVRTNPISYPSAAVIAKCESYTLLPNELNLALDNGWKQVLTKDEDFNFWMTPVLLIIMFGASAVLIIRRNKKRNQQY